MARDAPRVCEIPGRAADHDTIGSRPLEGGELGLGHRSEAHLTSVVLQRLADPLGSDAGGNDAVEQVLHHRVRLCDDPDTPSVFVHEARDDVRPDVRLAGAGRPLHGEVGGHAEKRPHDRVDLPSGCRVDDDPRMVISPHTTQDVGRGIDGEGVPRVEDPVGPLVDRLLLRTGRGRRRGRQRDREVVPRLAVDRELLDDRAVLEFLDDGDLARHVDPPIRRGRGERRGRRVQRERARPGRQPGARSRRAAQLDAAAVRAGAVGAVPVFTDGAARPVRHDHIARLRPEGGGFAQAREVRLPERLRLAWVVVDRGSGQAQCGFVIGHRIRGVGGRAQRVGPRDEGGRPG